MNKYSSLLTVALLAPLIVEMPKSEGHDVIGFIITRPDVLAKQLEKARQTAKDVQTRSVLNNILLWPVPRSLTICFLSGSPTTRHRVTQAMMRAWPLDHLTQRRLTFDPTTFSNAPDCGPNPNADVRVDFKASNGYWSYIGVDSTRYLPSMNLQGFTETTPDDVTLTQLVAHETGHALGLEHEHQSPAASVCKWDYNYLYSHYVWTSQADMHANLDKLQDEVITKQQHEFTFSTYDQSSIMHYYFEPQAFTDGITDNCFIPRQADTPSQQDLSAIELAYGARLATEQGNTKSISPELTKMLARPEYAQIKSLLAVKAGLLP